MTTAKTALAAVVFLAVAPAAAQACHVRHVTAPGVERCAPSARHAHGVRVVYGTHYAAPAYRVLPPPRYIVNQGPVLSGPGLDMPPHVIAGHHAHHHHHHHHDHHDHGNHHGHDAGQAAPGGHAAYHHGHPHGGHHPRVYSYQDSAVSGWAPYLRHGYYYRYDGGPYADPVRHTYDGMKGPPHTVITLPSPRRAHHAPQPQRRKIKTKMIHAHAH
jgi:hypothetical protein